MKLFIKIALPILTTVSVFLFATHFSPVQAAANSVWFTPGSSQRTTGQSFTVTVYASADPFFGTAGTNVTLKYPGNLVSVTNIKNGGALPSATITHNTQAQTISLSHSFYGYSSGFTDAPLIRFTVRANKAGKAVFNFTESFVRGRTVAKVASTYTIVTPSCPAGQIGTPPNCSTPAPAPTPTPPPAPAPAPAPTPTPPRPRPSTPTPSTSTPNTSAPSSSPTTPKKESPPKPAQALIIEDVDPQPRYTTSDVIWRTNIKASTITFKYGTTSGALDNGSTVTSSEDGLSHEVNLSGLELGTTYFYNIVAKDSTGKLVLDSGEFTTDAYPVTLRLTNNDKPLANTDVTLKGFSETYTTDDKGEAFTSLLPGDYTLQLTQEGATEEHTFTIKPLEIVGDEAPDTQVISVEFVVAAMNTGSQTETPPSLLPVIAAGVGLILLIGGFIGFILWRRHQSAADSTGYQSILSSDIYSSGPPPGYSSNAYPEANIGQNTYTQSSYPSATYAPPTVAPTATAQGIPLAEEEPLDMWSAPTQTYPPQSTISAPPLYPEMQVEQQISPSIITPPQLVTPVTNLENPISKPPQPADVDALNTPSSTTLPEETYADQNNTFTIHHQP